MRRSVVRRELERLLQTSLTEGFNSEKTIRIFDRDKVFYVTLSNEVLKVISQRALAFEISRGWLEVKSEIWYDQATNRIGVRTPYNTKLIEEFKSFAPRGTYAWDPAAKAWFFNPTVLEIIEPIVKRYYPDVENTTIGAIAAAEESVYDRLLGPLPFYVVKVAYRAILGALHPDRATQNGLTEREAHEHFVRVQALWSELEKEAKK